MSTVTSRNGARPPDNGRPFISFLDVHIASARKRLADFIELRAFLRFHGEVTSSWEAIRRRKLSILILSLSLSFSYLFSMKEISKMSRRKRASMQKTYSKFYGIHWWRKKFKVWRIDTVESIHIFLGSERLRNGWMLFIILLGNRRFILRLDKKIKNLIFVNNFPFPPSYSRFYLFLRAGLWFMILYNIHSKRK